MLALVLAVRFAVELTLLAVFAWWGYTLGGPLAAALCAVGVAAGWGLLLSPKARIRLTPTVRNGVEIAVFLVAAAALTTLGRPWWGVALVAVDVVILLALSRLNATTAGEPVN